MLDINDDPVTIEQIELAIVTRGFEEGWIEPDPPDRAHRAAPSAWSAPGPAGLAVAARAEQARPHGHGLRARRGARRPAALRRARRQAREVDHRPAREAARGRGRSSSRATSTWAATLEAERAPRGATTRVVVAIGSRVHRDLEVPGRELARRALRDGLPLPAQPLRWRRSEGRPGAPRRRPAGAISAEGKRVVVVGGGDTGMDCISNALREGAEDVLLLDVYPPLPAHGRPPGTPWPLPPKRTRTHLRARRGRRAPLRHRR